VLLFYSKSAEKSECKQSATHVTQIPDDVTDIDTDMSDPFMVSEYANEIFQNMKAREVCKLSSGIPVSISKSYTTDFTLLLKNIFY